MSSSPREFTFPTPSTTPAVQAPPPLKPNFHLLSFVLGLLVGLILVGGTLFLTRRADPPPIVLHPPPTPAPTASPLPTATPAPMTVFVNGAVQKPGLYSLPVDARVGDALARAGGLTAAANAALINQAEKLVDGAQIYIPVLNEETTAPQPPAGVSQPVISRAVTVDNAASNAPGGLINLNTASAEQLDSLPGIGRSKAEAIIAHRPYATIDDLDKVPGIGPSTINQLRALVTVQ
ncbi:MAG: ComEA family DNA-binding protein [Caldilineaceae bacterium]